MTICRIAGRGHYPLINLADSRSIRERHLRFLVSSRPEKHPLAKLVAERMDAPLLAEPQQGFFYERRRDVAYWVVRSIYDQRWTLYKFAYAS